MIRILIVDDMPIFLEYLRGCIEWEAYGFEICGEAHDGREAIEVMEKTYPDIILTDITMPYVDGLELADYVAANHPDISVVLITGNNEFEYARRALKIGVCDYIVKPFEKEELIFALLKLQDNINRVLEAKTEHERLEEQNREHILRKIVMGKHTNWANHMDQFDAAGIPFISDYLLVCTIKLLKTTPEAFENVANWEDVIIKILEQKIQLEGVCRIFKDYENNIVVLLNFSDEQAMLNYKTYELSDVNKLIKDSLHFESVIGVSGYCYGLNGVREAYLQALRACGGRKTDMTGGKVYDYKKMEPGENSALYSWKDIDSLNQAVEQGNEEKLVDTLRGIFAANSQAATEERIAMYSSLISILLSSIIRVGKTVGSLYGASFQPYQEILALSDNSQREEKIIEYYLRAVSRERRNTDRSHKIVEDVKAYIAGHYMEPELCINDISRELLINQTYLRSMFKNETQITISEYLTKYRMQLALELIKHTDDKFVVISEKVGYSDVSYFSKSFKKFYGVAPKEYRS